jgi:hypothetical protein
MTESLGRDVFARFTPPHARRAARIAPERRAGMVAAKAARFGLLNGRSVIARRVMGERVAARVSGTELLPVALPTDLWLAVAENERNRMRPTPSPLEQHMRAAQVRAAQRSITRGGFAEQAAQLGPRGLPRATSRGRLSPLGVDTGPAAAPHRMVTEAAFVASPDEVRAAGPMLGRRDQSRAVTRRSTLGPPSPSTGGGRARRAAQASGPGRQVGATRPDPAAAPTITRAAAPPQPNHRALTPPSDRVDAQQLAVDDAFDAPRAVSLPPVPGESPVATWQPLPRPGAVARRGALASELRATPAAVRRSFSQHMANRTVDHVLQERGAMGAALLGPAVPGPLPVARAMHVARADHVVRRTVDEVNAPAPRRAARPTLRRAVAMPRAATSTVPASIAPELAPMRTITSSAARVLHAFEPSAPPAAPAVPVQRISRSFEPSPSPIAEMAGERTPTASSPIAPMPTVFRAAEPAPAPTADVMRATVAQPAPPLPLAAAFAPRSITDDTRPLLPLVARASAIAAAHAATPGRVTTTIPTAAKQGSSTPTIRRSRFGASIASTSTSPVAPVALAADVRSSMQAMRATYGTASVSPSRPLEAVVVPIVRAAEPSVHSSTPAPASAEWGGDGGPPARVPTPARVVDTELRRSTTAPVDAPAAAVAPLAPARPVVAPVAGLAPMSAAARFVAAINERPADPVRAVPTVFAPLARAIAGPKPVAVRTGPSTQRALAKAGKQAVTVDNVVHLARAPETSPASVEVFAHELVHAARPSPIPRFFDDDHHSPEEELARATGQLMRAVQPPTEARANSRSAVAPDARVPTFGTAGLTVGAGGGLMSALAGAGAAPMPPPMPSSSSSNASTSTASASSGSMIRRSPDNVIRRSPVRKAAERRSPRDKDTRSSSGSSSASGSSSGGAVIRRSFGGSSSSSFNGGPPSSIFSSSGQVIRRAIETPEIVVQASAAESGSPFERALASLVSLGVSDGNRQVGSSTAPVRNELIAQIVDAIEERVIAELERRGRRHNPGVF